MLKVGLTGNIASGKSEVENIIRDMGYLVFDFDKLAHGLYLDSDVQKQLKKEFFTTERKEIAKVVFIDPVKKEKLEAIFNPRLYKKAQELFELNKNEKMVFFSGALIYEAEFDKLFDKIIFVEADFMLRLERLKKRNNFNDKDAMLRLNCQTSNYKSKADFVILNNDSLENLKNETMKVINSLI